MTSWGAAASDAMESMNSDAFITTLLGAGANGRGGL
jgi:hypothetical protein